MSEETVKGIVKIPANRKEEFEINEHESHLYHVQVTNKVHVPSRQEYIEKVHIMTYRQEVWNLYKDGISKSGTKIEILHDPTYKKPAAKKTTK
jgi:hypothetical protein